VFEAGTNGLNLEGVPLDGDDTVGDIAAEGSDSEALVGFGLTDLIPVVLETLGLLGG
jgi:hypothetical protein